MSEAARIFGGICEDQCDAPGQPCAHYVLGGYCTLGNHFRCPEYIVHNEPPLSFSAIDTYSQCHRKFYWNWLVGIEVIDKSWAVKLGSHAAKILDWLHDVNTENAVQLYEDYIQDLIRETTDPEDEEKKYGHIDIWKMKAMFDAYIKLDFHTVKGITEYEFKWNELEIPRVHGFIDFVHLVTYDEHFGYEFKWTGNPDNYGKFENGEQYMSYFIGDPKITRMTNRCFVSPHVSPKKATKKQSSESIFDFYQRVYDDVLQTNLTKYFIDRTYWRSEFDLDAYKAKAKRVAIEIMKYIDEGSIEPFYQNRKACRNPFICDFLRICENEISKPWEMTNCYKKRGDKKNAEGTKEVGQ